MRVSLWINYNPINYLLLSPTPNWISSRQYYAIILQGSINRWILISPLKHCLLNVFGSKVQSFHASINQYRRLLVVSRSDEIWHYFPSEYGDGRETALPNKDEESFLLLYEMQMMRTCGDIHFLNVRLLVFVEKERQDPGGFQNL